MIIRQLLQILQPRGLLQLWRYRKDIFRWAYYSDVLDMAWTWPGLRCSKDDAIAWARRHSHIDLEYFTSSTTDTRTSTVLLLSLRA